MSMSAPPDAPRYIRPAQFEVRATPARQFFWFLEALGWDWAYWGPMKSMPLEVASDLGAATLKRLGPLSSAHRTMLRNLRLAFPDRAEAELDNIATGAWETLGRTVAEMPHLSDMRPYVSNGRVEVIGAERLDAIRDSGRPAVLISGHLANWEVMASAICNRPLDCQITYRPANNPHIDKRINAARHAYGINVLTPKGAGTRELMRALSRGQSVALMNDQKFNQGMPVPFFGHQAMTAPGPTRLAIRYGAPLMPMSVARIGKAKYRVTVHEPFMPETGRNEDAAIYATLQRINNFMEERIREAPEQWFWMHNRWPKEAWRAAGII